MPKKTLTLSSLLLSMLLVACSPTGTGQSSEAESEVASDIPTVSSEVTSSSEDGPLPDDWTYYLETKINADKHLKVFRSFAQGESVALSEDELVIATAIQGFFAREGGEYYYQFERNDVWLNDLEKTYGFTFEDTTLEEMLLAFKDKFGGQYVLYRQADEGGLNVARSIAGVKDLVPVEESLKERVDALGFSMGYDARGMSEAECFEEFKDLFDNSAIIQQNPETTHEFLTDYGIAGRYFFFYPKDDTDMEVLRFRASVHEWAKDDCPIFGWVPNDEAIDVNIASTYGQFMIPSDWARNMSVFAAKSTFGDLRFHNPIKDSGIKAEQGKHYVTIMMSDGDNVQTWYNTFPMSEKYMAAPRGDFKMGWSIQPSLVDLGRNVMNYVYDNRDENDFYVCSVSGQGYMNPRAYPDADLDSFCKRLSVYLRNSDLSVVQLLDSGPDRDVISKYASIPELKGGIYCYGDRYAGGHGSVYWADDKPFVSIRETLWNADVSEVAKDVNSYSRDITSIEAYTAVNLHPWSMDYSDVVDFVALLDEDVEVVTADEFIRLITENVPHEDALLV